MLGGRIDRKSLAAGLQTRLRQPGGAKKIIREAAGATRDRCTSRRRTSNHSTRLSKPSKNSPTEMWDDADIEEEAVPAPEPEPEVPAEAAVEAAPEADTPAPEVTMGTEPKKLVFKHWIRPKFLQYTYLYDYQHNYYDDVINYLDRRNRGLQVEKPRAQTWGERALRTYLARSTSSFSSRSSSKDTALLKAVSTGSRFHRYHSKSLISRKYSTLGFNTVSI